MCGSPRGRGIRLRRKVQQYLQKLDEARSSVATSRRSASRAKSRATRETAVELDDTERELRDVKEEGRCNTEDRFQSEMDRLETEMRQRQKQREMEERDRAQQLKVAEEARNRAARKVHLHRAAESELNWDRRHDFEDPTAVATERPRSTERGACRVNVNAAETVDTPAQETIHNVDQEYPADASPQMPEPFVCEEDEGAQLPACDLTKNAAKPRREMPRDGGTPLYPSTWTSSNTERRESHSSKPSTFAKKHPSAQSAPVCWSIG